MEIAQLKLNLMEKGLKPTFGGLAGSSAIDMVNVVRGSFSACIDTRALCHKGGSVPYWYDIAAAVPICLGRGLKVVVTDAMGRILTGGNHDIYTPVAYYVCREEYENMIIEAIQQTIFSGFLQDQEDAIAIQKAA